jgi:hypothetical protein|tara:strand:+ start:1347 stop:1505 length:159 start_codon:yes stop_codon:yes gene_type:complete
MQDQDRFLTIFFGLLTLISLILILTNIPKAVPQGSRATIDNDKIVLLPSYRI